MPKYPNITQKAQWVLRRLAGRLGSTGPAIRGAETFLQKETKGTKEGRESQPSTFNPQPTKDGADERG